MRMCGKQSSYCEKMRKTCVDLALVERTVAVISATRGRGVGIPPLLQRKESARY
jgi:hypothetical protein